MDTKFKYLFKNSGYLLIGNFSSKILVFFLVPLYTYVLTKEEYGTFDLIQTTVLLLIPFFSFNIADAIMLFSIDKNESEQKEVFSIAIKYTVIGGAFFSIGFCLFVLLFNLLLMRAFLIPTILLFWAIMVNQNMVQIARGLNHVKVISIAGFISTIITVVLNLIFLLVLKWGIHGYFLATILAIMGQNAYLMIRCNIVRYLHVKLLMSKTEKQMLRYCLPLIFTTISWYINNAADRYTVTLVEGIGANGLYSVSYKIPSIMAAFQTIFIQSWQLSAVKEFDSDDGKQFIRTAYKGCQTVMVIICSLTIISTRMLAKILFSSEFYDAWICVPTLVFYVLFNTLSGTIGGVFVAKKDSNVLMKTAIIGSITNIILNVIMIFLWGILGAAISTAISSIMIWWLRFIYSKKYIDININKIKFVLEIVHLMIQAFTMTFITAYYGYIIQLLLFSLLIVLNIPEMRLWIIRKNDAS